jgi:hypothetical protein
MPKSTDDAERWRALASEARNIALEIANPEVKRALLFIAADYEHLARSAQKRSGNWKWFQLQGDGRTACAKGDGL